MNALREDLGAALDPTKLAGRLGMEPDPWQAKVLRSQSDRIILNCCRQSGKSTVAAFMALHTALYRPPSLVLILSPTERQSKELFRRCLVAYRQLGRPAPAETENRLSLELENGSRIVSLPGQPGTIRGFSGVSLLIVDEAAQVEDEVYLTVLPMLSISAGRLVLLSTPYGRRGFYFEAWHSEHGWEKVQVEASQCPRISDATLAEAQATMGEWWFKQEYLCQFMDTSTAAFSSAELQAAVNPELEPWIL